MLATGQSNHEKFKKYFKDNDTAKIISLLTEWESSDPSDPELYTSAINFYFSQSKRETISIEQEKPTNKSFELTDSSGAVVGYLGSRLGFDPKIIGLVIKYADKGIEKFPDRLDIRFGKCYILGRVEDFEHFTKEIIKTVQYSVVINNNWFWAENKKIDDGENFMLDAIQEYLKQLFNTGDDNLLVKMQQIGDTTIKYYPNNVEILSTTAVAYTITKNYDKALAYLMDAEEINPKDFIVLNNIAQAYKLKGDKVNAIRYYELTEKYGDKEAKKQARENISSLRR